jgi:hypothetical protein
MFRPGLTILLIFSLFFVGISQNKMDNKWVLGLNISGIRGGNIIDFSNNRSIDTTFLAFAMGSNCVSICDKEGNLLMYSNGCAIADQNHKIMKNGDSINFGQAWIDFCPFKYSSGYPVTQNSLILPDPGNYDENGKQVKNGYYLLHKRSELLKKPNIHTWTPGVSYSYVDMNGNNGNGKVIKKNKLIFETTNLAQGYMTACKHTNGRDWWIVQIREDTNIFFKILLTKDTVMVVDSQSLTGTFPQGYNRGQAVFTPDGSKWIAFNPIDKVIIYDFNRATGELSNLQMVNPQDSGIFVGVAVSPNSRFAYLSAKYDLYQLDLWADDIQASLIHIAHIDYFPDTPGFASTFSLAQLGPDCKIYIVNGGTNFRLHVINKPNEKGQACDFQQHSFYLPNLNYNGSLPNFPHFRMDEAEVCDSTLTSIFGELVWLRRDMKVWPNPSSGIFNIELPDVGAGKLVVTNINGQVIYERDVSNIINEERIDISNYPGGRYNVEFWPDRNVRSKSGDFDHRDNRVFYGVQVVKVE